MKRSTRLLVAAVLSALATLVGGVSLAGLAQAQGGSLYVRRVVSQNPGETTADLIYEGSAADIAGAKVSVNGAEVPVKSSAPLDLVADRAVVSIVIAPGPNLGKGGVIETARDSLKRMIDAAPDGVSWGITVAGDRATRIGDFTTNKEQAKAKLDRVGTSAGKIALYDAIRLASTPFLEDSAKQPNVLLVVGDGESAAAEPDKAFVNARGALSGSGASVFAAELNTFDPGPINQMVASSGGLIKPATDAASMGQAIDGLSTALLKQQHRITFDVGLQAGQIADIEVNVNGQVAKVSVNVGGDSRGKLRLEPPVITGGGGIPILDGPLGLVLVVAFTMVAAGLLFYSLTLLVVADDSLSNVLSPYADGSLLGDDEDDVSTAGRSALVQRAVDLTEQVAQSQGYLGRAEAALEGANIPLRAAEALTGYLAIVVLATLLGLLWTRNLVTGLIFGVLGAMLPIGFLNFIAARRRKAFMGQLPDTLQLLSGTLRAGYSLMQGIEAVSQEVSDPMGIELRRVVTESRLGRPVEEALESSAERMDSPDFAWAVMAIRIQREVGGNLSELLLTVAETMTARERLRREVAALTAEGRMSAYVLGALPPGLGAIMFVLNKEYTSTLFTDPLGIALLIIAGVSMIIGFAWMRKIINIEI